jgi:molybdenum-dependent DNA-binding transcriptional regulator ModE
MSGDRILPSSTTGKPDHQNPPRWNSQIILNQLRGLHRQSKPMWSRRIRRSHSQLYSAAIHCFGSYRKAVAAAGVDYRSVQQMVPGRWNRQTVCRELRRLHREHQPLHHAAAENKYPALVLAAYRYFGSYGAAINAAGLKYDRIRIRPMPSWDRKRVLRRLKELDSAETGLWKRALRRVEPYLERAARRNFGSYERAAKIVGIPRDRLKAPPYRIWSPKRIATDLLTLYRTDPGLLKPAMLMENNPQLLRACRRQMGSYQLALKAAGIPYEAVVYPPSMTADEVVNRLTSLFERGHDLRYSYLRRYSGKLFNAARKCFGTYEAAVNAAGLDYPPSPPIRHWTAPLVLKHLTEMHRGKTDLRRRQFRKSNLPLYQAAVHYFGSYQSAVKKAGIDYRQMATEQLHRQLPARRKLIGRTAK